MKLKNFTTSAIIASILVCSVAYAQLPFPKGLKWQMMSEVAFDYQARRPATKAQRNIAQSLWKNEIAIGKQADTSGFILVSTIDTANYQHDFTIGRLSGTCINPPNGDGTATAQPLYATGCPLKLRQKNKKTGKVMLQKLKGFCYLNLDDEPGELAKNHTQIAFDKKSNAVFFRTIMYGKHAPACDRIIPL